LVTVVTYSVLYSLASPLYNEDLSVVLEHATLSKYITSHGIEPGIPSIIQHRHFFRALSTMSSSSSPFSSTTIPSILSIPISEKLTKTNYPLWRAQVLPAIHATQLEGLITSAEKVPEQSISVTNDDKTVSKEINPSYIAWIARDQSVLGYIISSLTRETMMHVSWCTTAAHAWSTLTDLYSSQTRARVVNMCIALATTKKNQLTDVSIHE
jgi:hypothetical protein